MKVDLSKYTNPEYNHGAGFFKRLIWHVVSNLSVNSQIPLPGNIKVAILKLFGAKIGNGVVIKPMVNIKHPWFLEVGDFTWIGEEVWIDNLVSVKIGKNVCLSQGSMLLTGNHDYTSPTFNLITKGIDLEDGAWVGAKSIVCPGVVLGTHSVLAVNSVANKNLEPYGIYQGNPAIYQKKRILNSEF